MATRPATCHKSDDAAHRRAAGRRAVAPRCPTAGVGCTGREHGPRTPEGLERCRRAQWKHGARSQAVRDLLRANRQRWRALLALISA